MKLSEVLKPFLFDKNDGWILVKDDIAIIGHQVIQVAFKNCAPFTKCITKIDGLATDDASNRRFRFSHANI